MTTFGGIKIKVSEAIRDPENSTFTDAAVGYIVNSALAEIGRIAPAKFQEDLDPVENQFNYTLQQSIFDAAVPEIEIYRVELWDTTRTPNYPLYLIPPVSGEYTNFSQVGWAMRDGILELPYWVPKYIGSNTDNYLIRVWGYTPYFPLAASTDVLPLSADREEALVAYCHVEALRRLLHDRDLFTQFQLRADISDVSPASLLSNLNLAEAEWRRYARQIMVLREVAG